MAKMNPSRPGESEAPEPKAPDKTSGPRRDKETGSYLPAVYKTPHGFIREDR